MIDIKVERRRRTIEKDPAVADAVDTLVECIDKLTLGKDPVIFALVGDRVGGSLDVKSLVVCYDEDNLGRDFFRMLREMLDDVESQMFEEES